MGVPMARDQAYYEIENKIEEARSWMQLMRPVTSLPNII
jgi:hypothetical protein